MEMVRNIAVMCTARAVGFGTLAIGCIMFSFAYNPPAAFRAGALLSLLMAGVLLLKAHYALHQKPRHTEVWLYLDDRIRPREAADVQRFARVLREVYGRFAAGSLAAACTMFVIYVVLLTAGVGVGFGRGPA